MFLFLVSFMPAPVQSILELIRMPSGVVVALLLAILQNNLIMRSFRTIVAIRLWLFGTTLEVINFLKHNLL